MKRKAFPQQKYGSSDVPGDTDISYYTGHNSRQWRTTRSAIKKYMEEKKDWPLSQKFRWGDSKPSSDAYHLVNLVLYLATYDEGYKEGTKNKSDFIEEVKGIVDGRYLDLLKENDKGEVEVNYPLLAEAGKDSFYRCLKDGRIRSFITGYSHKPTSEEPETKRPRTEILLPDDGIEEVEVSQEDVAKTWQIQNPPSAAITGTPPMGEPGLVSWEDWLSGQGDVGEPMPQTQGDDRTSPPLSPESSWRIFLGLAPTATWEEEEVTSPKNKPGVSPGR